jgi:hypothetical protein
MMEGTDEYFAAVICVRGDVDNIGLGKEGSFGLCDSQGRDWICWQVDRESFRAEFESVLHDVSKMQDTLRRLGYFCTGGAQIRMIVNKLPEPIPWEDQLMDLRDDLGDDSDEDEPWKESL